MLIIKEWSIKEITGYKPITTYYRDFGIAEKFGQEAVLDTYNQAIKKETDYKIITELVMVLNWKIWEHYKTLPNLAKLYNNLWHKAANRAVTTFKGDELSYYYRTTD